MDINESYQSWKSNPCPDTYEQFGKYLLQFLTRQLRARYGEEAPWYEDQDAISRTVVEVLRDVSQFKGDSQFSSWATSILRHNCNDIEEERDRRNEVDLDEAAVVPDIRRSVEEKYALKEFVSHLSKSQQVLAKLQFQGYTDEEIADKLKIPVGTVKSRWNTILKLAKKK